MEKQTSAWIVEIKISNPSFNSNVIVLFFLGLRLDLIRWLVCQLSIKSEHLKKQPPTILSWQIQPRIEVNATNR